MTSKVFCLMGPTASGKTALALALSTHLPIEVVSIDSAMVYRGMDIGTAKPSRLEQTSVPHHLIDICNPDEVFSVSRCIECVEELIPAIQKRGHIPLLVGGTMMYFWALRHGLLPLPESNPEIREALLQRLKKEGKRALFQELKQVDLESTKRIHEEDTQRILRALEIYYISKTPWSVSLQNSQKGLPFEWVDFVIAPKTRTILHERIETRFHTMVKNGFLDEVKDIKERFQLTEDTPSMRMVGYRQALQFLNGTLSYEDFLTKAVVGTRQLAKRQFTWLRRFENATWVSSLEEERKLVAIISKLLHNDGEDCQ